MNTPNPAKLDKTLYRTKELRENLISSPHIRKNVDISARGSKNTEPPANGHGYIPQLRELLRSQVKLSTEFCSLLEAEKHSLVIMDIPSLAELTRKKERDLARIQRLDENIQEVSRRIISGKKDASGTIKLADTIPFLSQDEGLMVKEYQKKLSRLRTAIVTANHVNQKFTSDTLGYLNDAVTLICNGITSDPTYNTTSQEQRNKSIPALVSREV